MKYVFIVKCQVYIEVLFRSPSNALSKIHKSEYFHIRKKYLFHYSRNKCYIYIG